MTFRISRSLVAAALLSVGCATAGPKTPTVKPPEFADSAQMPTLDMPKSLRELSTIRIDVQMWVDENGKPEIDTFRAIGPGSDANQLALKQWLGTARYRPATLDGHPVRGLFKMLLEGRVGGR
ncbi:MAG: hypothetical protein M3Z17_12560 [Gemmatimonadota bacterium]|nr:hypothetical protein [Gemmatimonadota bacterium]